MNKLKQCTYTILLMATCFVASPFMIGKIWKSSSEAKKEVAVPPPAVNVQTTTLNGAQTPDTSATDPSNGVQDPSVSEQTPGDSITVPTESGQSATTPAAESFTFVQADPSYFSDALFIGDSRTVGISEYGTLNNADFFCSVGLAAGKINEETVDGMTFDDKIKAKQYGKVYVMLGINEVGNDFEYTYTAYRAIVEKIKANQPNAIIYVQANLHVSASAQTNYITNEAINYLNSRIASLADNKKVFYIDINPVYDDESGNLTESYTSDGVHPLAAYYKQWCEWLCMNTVPTPIFTPQDGMVP
ncbi:MAG: lipase [Ruminococcus sp.]|nr:lipase [Ruminococcus sp.]